MKKTIFVITVLSLLSVFTIQGCDSSSSDLENAETALIEAERDLEIAKSEIEAEVGIYRQEIATDIRKNNQSIVEIKKKIEGESAEMKAAHDVRIETLERANTDLKRRIDNFSVTDRDNWSDFKDQFTQEMDDLGQSLDDFFSENTTSNN
jgi:tRNA U55 pseudouridine synthase TruB